MICYLQIFVKILIRSNRIGVVLIKEACKRRLLSEFKMISSSKSNSNWLRPGPRTNLPTGTHELKLLSIKVTMDVK